MPEKNIIQLFIKAVEDSAQQLAFIEGLKKITYTQLLKQVELTAYYFTKSGIGKGDKVLVFIPMKTELYVTVLALLYIGACPVFLDEWVSIGRLKECLKTVPCKAIIAERKILFVTWFINPLRKLKKLIPFRKKTSPQLSEPVDVYPADTALITFTTGSMGTPKAANRTHRFLAAQHVALQPLLANDFQITLTLLPVVVLLNLSLGKTNVLPKRKLKVHYLASINYVLQLIQQHTIQSIIASPAITVAIANRMIAQNVSTTIQQAITGGGPVFPDEAKVIVQAFPQANATVVYGSTEAEPISIINMAALTKTTAETMQVKGLPVGALHEAIQVAVIPFTKAAIPNQSVSEWERIKLPNGHSGEVVVSGPHVLPSYINNEAAQRQNKFLVDGILWHRTGDEGSLDKLNNLYFRGRCTEVIHYQNQIIYPLISTWLLKQQLPVGEAAILLWKEKLLLVIEEKDRALQSQLLMILKDTIFQDATIHYLPHIPKDRRHNTKIDYEKLRYLLAK